MSVTRVGELLQQLVAVALSTRWGRPRPSGEPGVPEAARVKVGYAGGVHSVEWA